LPFLPNRQKLIKRLSGFLRRRLRNGPPVADKIVESPIVLSLIFNHLLKNDGARLVAEVLKLFGILGNVMALVQF